MRNRLILACAVAACICPAQAGYYATVTGRGTSFPSGYPVGASTGCYLVPSMAVFVASGGTITVDVLGSDGGWSGYYTQAGPSASLWRITGTFAACSANPLTTALVPLAGGVSDPAISGNSISGGGSSGSSGSSADIQALTSAVTNLGVQAQSSAGQVGALNANIQNTAANGEYDVSRGGAIFGFFFSTILLLWYVSVAIGEVLNLIRGRH